MSFTSSSAARFCGVTVAALVALELKRRWRRRRQETYRRTVDLPEWLQWIADGPTTYRVMMREWEDPAWRKKSGWQGSDLIHGPHSAVSIPLYYFNTTDKVLRGPVTFGANSESHRGFCHGGAMTSAMDDVLGHVCFMAVGSGPWTGATVQVNVQLMKPVRVGQTLLVEAKVTQVEKAKKVSVEASLSDETGEKYAQMTGLSIAGAKIQPVQSELDKRTWSFDEAHRIMFDSAWDTPTQLLDSLCGA